MRISQAVWAMFLALAALLAPPVWAAKITGVVREDTLAGNLPPIGGVRIRVVPQVGQPIDGGITNANGVYQVDGVGMGKIVVECQEPDYLGAPETLTADVKLSVQQLSDVLMVKSKAKAGYYSGVAGSMLVRVRAVDDRTSGLKFEWTRLGRMRLPPVSRCYVAQGLGQQDQELVRSVPIIAAYQEVQPDQLQKLGSLFMPALEGKDRFPGTNIHREFKIPNLVASDAIAYWFTDPTLGDEKAEGLFNAFEASWTGSEILGMIRKEHRRPDGGWRRSFESLDRVREN